ncbi:MAG TPA: sulfotransferase [Cyanobacteria bacterium UBA11149]|nr:sulfotransferase [Cyanobacteria bacterium UBA11367]HBE57456.1 sulfotransferase [Cyanobacteria bacterium UBA11366]HBK66065.1 sulfotransferase [Cyanobacteria bacterium UBA11166]HBR76777.1 sulfotransferase [Cyanobacteria bacterium UBA11159]HBS71532.1 sulfotransferase [Cyanobacteria bacterium UBA11153]HBW89454.1 sulfotransferase [Cyanobacteria bacterium UBA11149]HCA97363.1 sulfotransferase [Cyanobacteria bacterium UBA9226]
MNLPNFLILGVQKAGTTSIYNYLRQHPQVYMSPVKETNFLERDWEKENPRLENKYKEGKIDSFEKYCHLFANVTDEIAIGEVSPNYLFNYQSSSELIQRYIPHAKLIAILRHPVERAYSDYLMNIRDGVHKGNHTNFSDQIKFRSDRSFPIRKGFYYTPLNYYFDKFSPEQIKVFLYEDLCQDPVSLLQNIFRFIGVDDSFIPDISQKAQVAKVPKSNFLNNLIKTKNPIRKAIASGMGSIFPLEIRHKIRDSIIQMNSQEKTANPLSSKDRQELINLYREDIIKLQDLIHRDLSGWLK